MIEKFEEFERQFNIKIETPYKKDDKISSVTFDFEPEIWADLANKEGDLLPICCGNVSTMRDVFVRAMRENGEMRPDDMATLVVNMSGHEYDDNHPATHVEKVYEALLDCLEFRGKGYSVEVKPDAEDALARVAAGHILNFCKEQGYKRIFSSFGERGSERASHNLGIYTVLPSIKILHETITELAFDPVEGYAIVRNANNELYEFRNSELAIMPTRNQAEKILADWVKTEQLKEGDAEIRPVRVSVQKGIEFIEEANPVKYEVKAEITRELKDSLFDKLNELRTENDESDQNDKVEAILHEAIKKIGDLKLGKEEEEGSWD